jgi:hypothetical protein
MLRKALLAVVFLAFGSVAVLAADFNGKWTATVESPRGTQTITFNFTVDGAKLTGTVTTPRGDMPISDGKIEGDNLSFATVMTRDGNEFKMLYTGKTVGDTIKFTRQFGASGDRPPQEFTATRVK